MKALALPSAQALQATLDVLGLRAGLRLQGERVEVLTGVMAERSAALGLEGCDRYPALLRADDGVELQTLIDRITVGETYFFRTADFDRCFVGTLLPAVLQARLAAKDRRLHIWSAASSSGEEPYSIAIWLRECGVDPTVWNVEILATDVNTRHLSLAREASYGAWSFRGTPPDHPRMLAHFEPAGRRHRVRSAIRDMVTLRALNLATDPTPSSTAPDGLWDVIFVRNVLMYFDVAVARRVVEGARERLRPGGLLFVGECETLAHVTTALEPRSIDRVFYYARPDLTPRSRKSGVFSALSSSVLRVGSDRMPAMQVPPLRVPPLPVPARPPPWLPVVAPLRTPSHTSAQLAGLKADIQRRIDTLLGIAAQNREARPELAAQALGRVVDLEPGRLAARLDLAALLLELGRNLEAVTLLSPIDGLAPLSARAHLLLGVACHGLGELQEALARLRAALFLDADLTLGHYFMGKTLEALGESAGAVHEYTQTIRCVHLHPAERLDLGMAPGALAGVLERWLAARSVRQGVTT